MDKEDQAEFDRMFEQAFGNMMHGCSGAVLGIVLVALLCSLFGCKSKQQAIDTSVAVVVDTTAVTLDSVRVVEQRRDSVHVIALQEVWETIAFNDSGGVVMVQTDGTVIMRGVKSLQRTESGSHSIRAGTDFALDSTAMHARSVSGTTSRDSTSKVGTAITDTDQRYITIGKYAAGAIIMLVLGVVITLSIWWFGRKIP